MRMLEAQWEDDVHKQHKKEESCLLESHWKECVERNQNFYKL